MERANEKKNNATFENPLDTFPVSFFLLLPDVSLQSYAISSTNNSPVTVNPAVHNCGNTEMYNEDFLLCHCGP